MITGCGTIVEPLDGVNKNITICNATFTFATKVHTFYLIFLIFLDCLPTKRPSIRNSGLV